MGPLCFLMAVSTALAAPPEALTNCQQGVNDYLLSTQRASAPSEQDESRECRDGEENPKEAMKPQENFARDYLKAVPPIDEPRIPIECFWTAMARRMNPDANHRYAICDSSDVKPQTMLGGGLVPPPCVNKNFVNLVRNAFIEVLDCVGGITYQEMFSIIATETQFQVNLFNSSNSFGLGQVQLNTVKSIDRNHLFQKYGLDQKPECKPFQWIFDESKNRQSDPTACEMMSMPENPSKNLLYAATAYKAAKNFLSVSLALSQAKISAQDRPLIVRDLTLYAYNGGDRCVSQIFNGYIKERGTSSPLTYDEFSKDPVTDEHKDLTAEDPGIGFKSYLRKHFGEGGKFCEIYSRISRKNLEKKRREIWSYVNDTGIAADNINSVSGRNCALVLKTK